MATKNVALEDDVVIEISSMAENGDCAGFWSNTEVSKQTYDHLTINGSPVVHQVTAKFQFKGTDPSNNPCEVDSTVTLSASPSVLTYNGDPVLVDGDTAHDNDGNTVRIVSSRHLKTG